MSDTGDGEERDEFVEAFHKQLSEVDALGQMVLKAHADVESTLNYFFQNALLYPRYFEDNRIGFADRVQLARALTPEIHEHPDWRVILGLNAVRNEVAHYGNREKRTAKIARLREFMLKPFRPKLDEPVRKANDQKIITYAALMGSGLLLHAKDEIRKARGLPIEDE